MSTGKIYKGKGIQKHIILYHDMGKFRHGDIEDIAHKLLYYAEFGPLF